MSTPSPRHGLVTAAVLLICLGILTLLTDIETRAVRWLSCGPLAAGQERQSELCR
ncbi:MAG: hypothetical protein VKN13_06385 [Cyanobacteriota bacterium]|nr:hypothetical protein [Cyanobacteriota bacterium]